MCIVNAAYFFVLLSHHWLVWSRLIIEFNNSLISQKKRITLNAGWVELLEILNWYKNENGQCIRHSVIIIHT